MAEASHQYPNLLVDVLRYLEIPDTPELQGGRSLVFLDDRGALVSLRLRRTTADRLLLTLEAGPTKAPE
jgi:hypothetical protein